MPIPKRIHQIWIDFGKGVKIPPKKYDAARTSWARLMPDYECYLWGDAEIETLISEFASDAIQRKYRRAAPVQKTDIARFVILKQYGGFYVDCDCTAFKRLDELLGDNLVLVKRGIGVTNCLIGAEPHHPFLSRVLTAFERTKRRFPLEDHYLEVLRSYGPAKLTFCWWRDRGGVKGRYRVLTEFEFLNPHKPGDPIPRMAFAGHEMAFAWRSAPGSRFSHAMLKMGGRLLVLVLLVSVAILCYRKRKHR